jgi:hypothetical protein
MVGGITRHPAVFVVSTGRREQRMPEKDTEVGAAMEGVLADVELGRDVFECLLSPMRVR